MFSYHRLGPWASLVAASRRSVRLRITGTTIGGGTGFLDDETLAHRGVIIATGGFEWNPDLVTAFLRGPMIAPASVPSNKGDGLVMAMRAGAGRANMPQAWSAPTVRVPGDDAFGRPRATLLNRELTLPGSSWAMSCTCVGPDCPKA